MGLAIVQVNIDDTSDRTLTGTSTFDRDNGGVLIPPQGTSFPGSPVEGEWFWRTDEQKLYRRGASSWESVTASAGTHASTHKGDGADAIAVATQTVAGLESAADKTKLDGIAAGATNTPLTSTAPVNVTKSTAAVGTASEAARQDHKHDITTTTAGAAAPGDTAAEGSSSSLARADHRHSLPSFGSTTGTFCQGDDSRLSDARTPTAHATSHKNGGSDEVATATAAANAIPKAGAGAKLDVGWLPTGSTGTTVCIGNDSRLSDARTPTTHAASHQSGGSDSIKLDDLAAPDDNTDLNATTGAHGLLPKLGGGTTNFLRADGTWSAPPSGGEANTASNVGTAGVGVFKQKSGVDLQFKKLNAGSAKVTVTDDTGNDEVDVDVVTGTTANSVCIGNDSRLSDARTPTTHATSHKNGGSDEVAVATAAANAIPKAGAGAKLDIGWLPTGSTGTTVCVGNDSRLSDARTPTAHAASHKNGGSDEVAVATAAANAIPKAGAGANLDIGWLPTGSTSTTVCVGNDSRLSDARTPTAHATSHQSGGGDSIKLDDLAAPDDNTDLNATTLKHGLLMKLGGGTTNFLRADGAWAAPTGGSGITAEQHKTLRQLIHFIDGGPAEGFVSGAYRETTGTVFPSAIIWWESSGKLKKIVEKTITWTGVNPTTVTWKVYDTDGSTVLATVSDSISYSGPFETSRTRTIS